MGAFTRYNEIIAASAAAVKQVPEGKARYWFMATARVLVLRAPGVNCDEETQFAFERAGASAERVHINRLREQTGQLDRYQIMVVPGGFSYGDDIAAGKILGVQLARFLSEPLQRFRDKEKLILGICNGF